MFLDIVMKKLNKEAFTRAATLSLPVFNSKGSYIVTTTTTEALGLRSPANTVT